METQFASDLQGAGVALGRRLREIRERKGYTTSVAILVRERTGVKIDSSYLSRIELGKAALPFRTLFALLRFYGVRPEDYFASVFASTESRARTAETLDRLRRLEEDASTLRAQFEGLLPLAAVG